MTSSKITCKDCGNAPVDHWIKKTNATLGWLFAPISTPLDTIWKTAEPHIGPFLAHSFSPRAFRLLSSFGLGTIVRVPDDKLSGRAACFWKEAQRRGITMWEYRLFGMSQEMFVVEWNGKTLGFDGLPRPGKKTPESLRWIDDKGILRIKFKEAGFPVAKGGVIWNWKQAESLFESLSKPVIMKPRAGSRSRHTTTHIETPRELRHAYKTAKILSPWIVMEEELTGLVHRATVIGGKLVGILQREPASVVGDGRHTVRELIKQANEDPKRNGPVFHKISLHDHEHSKELARVGLSLESVPQDGQVVLLSQKASRGLGGGATDLTDEAHPDNKALFEAVAALLEDSLVGIDFIIDDMSVSWKNQPKSGIIECNSLPFIDLHLFPLKGKPRDTAGALWDIIFPDSNPQK